MGGVGGGGGGIGESLLNGAVDVLHPSPQCNGSAGGLRLKRGPPGQPRCKQVTRHELRNRVAVLPQRARATAYRSETAGPTFIV